MPFISLEEVVKFALKSTSNNDLKYIIRALIFDHSFMQTCHDKIIIVILIIMPWSFHCINDLQRNI